MGMNMVVLQIVNEFKKFSEVEAITLAGSGATSRKDNFSDIDIDIIVSKEIPVESRREIIKRTSDYMEINNTFWGPGDEFLLRTSNVQMDIAYFYYDWLEEELHNILDLCRAKTGYSTCFWSNIKNSICVYDKSGRFHQLQEKTEVNYPRALKDNIIKMNYPILKNNISSYYNQINKAILRNDLVSINHRIAEFLASYFDIIFAVNEYPHPGEKRLIDICSKLAKRPENFKENIYTLLTNQESIMSTLDKMMEELNSLLKEEELIK